MTMTNLLFRHKFCPVSIFLNSFDTAIFTLFKKVIFHYIEKKNHDDDAYG